MKILICGEGKHDIGITDFWCDKTKDYISIEGWMQPLIRAIRSEEVVMSVRKRNDLVLLPKQQAKYRPQPEGHGAKALIAKLSAIAGGYDAVVYMVDADSTDIKRWQEIAAQISDGFGRIESPLPAVACIPMSASESWLLADGNAWLVVTGNSDLELPKRPEAVWGERNNPEADHPHRLFARICASCDQTDGSGIRFAISQASDVETLLARCPQSFAPFYTALKAA